MAKATRGCSLSPEQAGQINLRYGVEPGVLFYTHISDQYAPFHTKVINATVRDATHVLDNGQRSTRAAVNATILGGSGCGPSGLN